jgi:polyphosphate glucokinase
LVVAIEPGELAAILIGPWAEPITAWARVPLPLTSSDTAVRALWELVETLGEFDRISAAVGPDVSHTELAERLARESLRPARVVGELSSPYVIESHGVELVIALGAHFGSSLFVDGVPVPGFALGNHRLRKGMTYAEYLGGDAADRLGRRKWNDRAQRAIREVVATFHPRRVYLVGRDAALVHGDLPDCVECVRDDQRLVGALALWAPLARQ